MNRALILTAIWASLATPAFAKAPPIRIRGTIVSTAGDRLVIKTRDGKTVNLDLAKDYSVGGVKKASLSDIKPNVYVGSAAVKLRNGLYRALEVHIFPASKRGVGEGSRAWDLAPHSMMTNAPVTGIVKNANGRILTLTYPGGQKKILVGPDTPVVAEAKATHVDVKPGAGVVVLAASREGGGSYAAKRIIVGLGGIVPPQ